MDSKTKIGLGAAAFVVALGAAVGVGAFAANLASGDTVTAAGGSGQSSGKGGNGSGAGQRDGSGARGGFDSAALAKSLATKLGAAEEDVAAALTEALAAGRPEGGPSGAPTGSKGGFSTQRLASIAKVLAEKLDLEEAKVLAALQEVMPSGAGGNQPAAQPSSEPTK